MTMQPTIERTRMREKRQRALASRRARTQHSRSTPSRAALLIVLVALGVDACTLSHTPFRRRGTRVGETNIELNSKTKTETAIDAENVDDADTEDDEMTRGGDEDVSNETSSKEVAEEEPDPEDEQETAKAEQDPPRARAREGGGSTKLDALAAELGAKPSRIEQPCLDETCSHHALDRFIARMSQDGDRASSNIRILHLGDSHVAADYITGTIRTELQSRLGDAGRGFMAIDQRLEFGGRRIKRAGWRRSRIVDPDGEGEPFGFSGMAIESTRRGARAQFALEPKDHEVTVFFHAHPDGPRLKLFVGKKRIGEINTRAIDEASRTRTFKLPRREREGRSAALVLEATGEGALLFGLSFATGSGGILYDAVGPVGADARVYLSLDPDSFAAHLRALAPDLVVIMVGGNDALALRRSTRTPAEIRSDHEQLISRIREALPNTDCMLWSPMDAGEREGQRIKSKTGITEVRRIQKDVATKKGCAFWDMFQAMGGEGSFGRWHAEGIMNDDLVHPRRVAGELLGHLFAKALMNAVSPER